MTLALTELARSIYQFTSVQDVLNAASNFDEVTSGQMTAEQLALQDGVLYDPDVHGESLTDQTEDLSALINGNPWSDEDTC